jgi:ATP-binding cassette subfamily F protein uup
MDAGGIGPAGIGARQSRTTIPCPRNGTPKNLRHLEWKSKANSFTESEPTLATLLNGQGLTKSFGAAALFREIGFVVDEGDRIGLIGPNGSGKSTLLGVLAGEIEPDEGEVARRKLTRLSYVPQVSEFAAGLTARDVVQQALKRAGVHESEWEGRTAETLGRAGFEDFETEARTYSGGWKKRLSIAQALAQHPDVLLLDEPTNHLDLAGIEWLEELLATAPFACVVVSHDRYFLENVATEMVELNKQYPWDCCVCMATTASSGEEGRVSGVASQAAGVAGESRQARDGVAAPRAQGAHD